MSAILKQVYLTQNITLNELGDRKGFRCVYYYEKLPISGSCYLPLFLIYISTESSLVALYEKNTRYFSMSLK
jgi:hypothetical protein